MTLATLQGMNFAWETWPTRSSSRPPTAVCARRARSVRRSRAGAARHRRRTTSHERRRGRRPARNGRASRRAAAGGVVDPLQWWGALTQQFQQIAAGAMKDAAKQDARVDSREERGDRRGQGPMKPPQARPPARQDGAGCAQQAAAPARKRAPRAERMPFDAEPSAMKLFPSGHATHPQWQHGGRPGAGAAARADGAARLRARADAGPAVHHRPLRGDAQDILDHLGAELPEVTDWAGTVGVGIVGQQRRVFRRAGAGA